MEIKRFTGGMLEANCYILQEKGKGSAACIIIDPGYSPKKIIRYIRDNKLTAGAIILTHHHYDHSDGAELIRKELECPVMIHRMDGDMYRGYADEYLEEGDTIEVGKEKFRVVHTPGHTAGSICLYSSDRKICFTGDTIFNVDLGRTDLEDGSDADMIKSIRRIAEEWGNDVVIYPGHGDSANMKKVRKINREFQEIVNGN